MEFNFKGKTFNLDLLEETALESLEYNTISRSYVFHLVGKMQKPFLLLRAGDFIDESFINKYKAKGLKSVFLLNIATEKNINEYKDIFQRMDKAKDQDTLLFLRDELFLKIAQDYLGNKDQSFLNFTIAAYEQCFILPQEVVNLYHSRSMVLYTRAILSAAISSLVLLANGHIDYQFIKEFYNIAFTIDIGLLFDGEPSYHLMKACELERNTPGEGLPYLQKKSESDYKLFKEHPVRGEKYLEEFVHLFRYPEIIENIKYHHEKYDGSGFPEGYFYSALSDTETILVFCDYIVPFEEFVFHEDDGKNILSQYFDKIDSLNTDGVLPIKSVMQGWESIMRWATSKKGVAS